MTRFLCVLTAAAAIAGGSADAAGLTRGIYSLVGEVASTNGNPNCGQLGLAPKSLTATTIVFPAAGKGRFALYVPSPGAEEYCGNFVKQPTAGLDGYSTTATCGIAALSGGASAVPGFAFTFKVRIVDSNSAIGTLKVTVPDGLVGGGCEALVDVTYVRTGS